MSDFKTYDEFSNATSSEKILLAHIHCKWRAYTFTVYSGSIYEKTVDYVVTKVEQDDVLLTLAADKDSVVAGKYYFDILTKKLYIYSADIATAKVLLTFRMFFSNAAISLSWDLSDDGDEVYYEPRIESTTGINIEVDEKIKGSALIGSSTLKLFNSDQFFNSFFDKYVWDNKEVKIYSYNRDLAPSDASIIYQGVVDTKSIEKSVSFKMKDYLKILDENLSNEKFDSSTESVSLSVDGIYKRRIFGKVDGFKPTSIDMLGDKLTVTGTVSASSGTSYMVGTDTVFLSELSPDDVIYFISDLGVETRYTIENIVSDTHLILSEQITQTFSDKTVQAEIEIPYQAYNRDWFVSPNILSEPKIAVVGAISNTKLELADVTNIIVGDSISIDTTPEQVRVITKIITNDKYIVLDNALSVIPTSSNYVYRRPIQTVYYSGKEVSTDYYTVSNDSDGCVITFDDDFEKNFTPVSLINQNIYKMDDTDNVIYFNSKVSEQPELQNVKPRDWVSFDGADWYEVLGVKGDVKSVKLFDYSDINTSTDVITIANHGMPSGMKVELTFNGTVYDDIWVSSISADTIKLATNSGLSAFFNFTTITSPTDPIGQIVPTVVNSSDVSASDKLIITRTSNTTGAQLTGKVKIKRVSNLNDDSILSVNCYGETEDDTSTSDWIKSTAQFYKKILIDFGYEDILNTDSFDDSDEDSIISLTSPSTWTSTSESFKSIINKLGDSTHSALTVDADLKLRFINFNPVLDFDNLQRIDKYDLISFGISQSDPNLLSTINGSYCFQDINYITGESDNSIQVETSDFINDYIGINKTDDRDYYLYKEDEVKYLMQQDLLFNSQASNFYKMTSDLRFINLAIGDVVIIDFLDQVFSNQITNKLVMIIAIKKTDRTMEIKCTDLANILNKRSVITPDGISDYDEASDEEKLLYTFITDALGLVGDDEDTQNTNIIF